MVLQHSHCSFTLSLSTRDAVGNVFQKVFCLVFDVQLMGHMLVVAERIVKELGVAETKDYRVVINNELDRQQAVYHPQIHVMAGRKMSWPPG